MSETAALAAETASPGLTCGADPVRCKGNEGSSNTITVSQNAVRNRNFMALSLARDGMLLRHEVP